MPGAGGPFVLTFDENGNGTLSNNGGPPVSNPGKLMMDPTPGGLGVRVLTYPLGAPVVPGDVAFADVCPPTPLGIGDLIRFYNDANNNPLHL